MNDRKNPSVVIIGAGMTGILLVIRLKQAGINNITLLEKAETLGGTWRENTYPGVACDVPSHAYTYSFEPNPNWSNHFPPGTEIYQYFKMVFEKYGVDKHTHFQQKVNSCVFNDETSTWSVKTEQGMNLECDLLFSATGILHKPNYPDIQGIKDFKGDIFHSARWDHDVTLEGKRIGVIGTGSSAAQLIPKLINTKDTQVTVFQRTPQWIVHMADRQFSEDEKQRFTKQPWRMKLIRKMSAIVYSQGTQALTGDSWWDQQVHKLMSWNARRYLNKSISDPVLRKKLTPDYKLGCKRVVINSTFYDAIQKPNAHLVTDGIDHIEAGGVVSKDGKLHELDVLVLATGFDPAAFMRPMEFRGRNSLSIDDAWAKKVTAYQSMFVPEFPNFFLMLGPNSPIGNQSVIEISEHQTDYVLQLIKAWQNNQLPYIEATKEAQSRWTQMIRDRMKHTVWTSGCQSWYLDEDGDALAWPDSWKRWLKVVEKPDIKDFVN